MPRKKKKKTKRTYNLREGSNPPGRPPGEVKTKQVFFRLAVHEVEADERTAERMGFSSMSDFYRFMRNSFVKTLLKLRR